MCRHRDSSLKDVHTSSLPLLLWVFVARHSVTVGLPLTVLNCSGLAPKSAHREIQSFVCQKYRVRCAEEMWLTQASAPGSGSLGSDRESACHHSRGHRATVSESQWPLAGGPREQCQAGQVPLPGSNILFLHLEPCPNAAPSSGLAASKGTHVPNAVSLHCHPLTPSP